MALDLLGLIWVWRDVIFVEKSYEMMERGEGADGREGGDGVVTCLFERCIKYPRISLFIKCSTRKSP